MPPALQLDQVSVTYDQQQVLHNISLSLQQGRLIGVIGPNGAGKTTFFRAAMGLIPYQGKITINAQDTARLSREAMAKRIAYLPQGSEAHWPITARRLIALGRMPHHKAFAPVSADDDTAIENAMQRCEVSHFAHRPIHQLSAGERARVLLARALATEAPILIADEPAAHLDPAHQLGLMALLKQEAARGTTVIVTLHDLALASRFCDELVVIHAGRIAAHSTPDQALTPDITKEVFGISTLRISDANSSALIAWSTTSPIPTP